MKSGKLTFSRLYRYTLTNHIQIVISLIILYVLCGIILSIFRGETLQFADERLYVSFSNNLSTTGMFSSHGESPTAQRAPGYGLFLYALSQISDDIVFYRIINMLLIGIALYFSAITLSKYGNKVAATVYVVIIFFYPVVLYTGTTLYPQALIAALLSITIYILTHKTNVLKLVTLSGFLFGILILTLPLAILLAPLFLLMIHTSSLRISRVHISILTSVFLICAMICVTPWLIRNYLAFDQFVFISANSGLMLIKGNSENAKSNTGPAADTSSYENRIPFDRRSQPVEYDKALRQFAIEWVSSNPERALILYMEKFLHWFGYNDKLATKSQDLRIYEIIMFVTYYPLLILGVMALAFATGHKIRTYKVYTATLYLLIGASYAVFFTRIRYRVPFDIIFFTLTALQIELFLRRYLNHLNTSSEATSASTAEKKDH